MHPILKKKYLFLFTLFFGAGLVFYFSWLPDPDIGRQPYFPGWLGEWTNKYGNLRTAVPFVFLGALSEFGLVKDPYQWKKRFSILALLFVLVFVAEIGQLFLTDRHFDYQDILWGVAGSLAGLVAGYTAKKLLAVG